RDISKQFSDKYWQSADVEHRFPQEFWDTCSQAGVLGVMIPEKDGGAGLGVTEASLILQEIANSPAAMDGSSAIHFYIFGANPIVLHASEEQLEKYLPAVANGSPHVSFSIT